MCSHLQATHSLLLLPEVTRPEVQLLTFRTAKTATPATVPTRGKLNSHLWPAFSWWCCALTSLLHLPPSHGGYPCVPSGEQGGPEGSHRVSDEAGPGTRLSDPNAMARCAILV